MGPRRTPAQSFPLSEVRPGSQRGHDGNQSHIIDALSVRCEAVLASEDLGLTGIAVGWSNETTRLFQNILFHGETYRVTNRDSPWLYDARNGGFVLTCPRASYNPSGHARLTMGCTAHEPAFSSRAPYSPPLRLRLHRVDDDFIY